MVELRWIGESGLQCHFIELSLLEDSIFYYTRHTKIAILIDSTGLIDSLEYTCNCHTPGSIGKHISNESTPISYLCRHIEGDFGIITLDGIAFSDLLSR